MLAMTIEKAPVLEYIQVFDLACPSLYTTIRTFPSHNPGRQCYAHNFLTPSPFLVLNRTFFPLSVCMCVWFYYSHTISTVHAVLPQHHRTRGLHIAGRLRIFPLRSPCCRIDDLSWIKRSPGAQLELSIAVRFLIARSRAHESLSYSLQALLLERERFLAKVSATGSSNTCIYRAQTNPNTPRTSSL